MNLMHLFDEEVVRFNTPNNVNCAKGVSSKAEVHEVYFVRDIGVQGDVALFSQDVDKTQTAEDIAILILEKIEEDDLVVGHDHLSLNEQM